MKRIATTFMMLFALFVLSACGVNDFPDSFESNETNATGGGENNATIVTKRVVVVVPSTRRLAVDKPEEDYMIIFRVEDLNATPLPKEVLEVKSQPIAGSFLLTEMTTNTIGEAALIYRSPQVITNQSFETRVCLKNAPTVCNSLTIALGTDVNNTDTNNTDTNQTDIGNDSINYDLVFESKDGTFIHRLGEIKEYKLSLIDADTNVSIPPSRIVSFSIESRQPDIIGLIDKLNDPSGEAKNSISLARVNDVIFDAKASDTVSGLSDIIIEVRFVNAKGYERTIKKSFAITVFSGPPTSFQIVHGGTSYDPTNKEFEAIFVISAVDKYGNKINNAPTISVSIMAGYAKDPSGQRIVYGQNSAARGIYGVFDKGLPAKLETVGIAPFSDFNTTTLYGIDTTRDFVALFGNVRTYEMNGKWEIGEIVSSNALAFLDEYAGGSYDQVGFAVGHNYRQDRCSDAYREYIAKVDAKDGKYLFDENGYAKVVVSYPAEYMPGKKIALTVNYVGQNPETSQVAKAGEVRFETLYVRAPWFLEGASVSLDPGETRIVRHSGIVTTDSGDTFNLVDSSFSCNTNKSQGIVAIELLAKNDPYQTNRDVLCNRQNVYGFNVSNYDSYLIYRVTAGVEGGTFVLSECKPDDEFSF